MLGFANASRNGKGFLHAVGVLAEWGRTSSNALLYGDRHASQAAYSSDGEIDEHGPAGNNGVGDSRLDLYDSVDDPGVTPASAVTPPMRTVTGRAMLANGGVAMRPSNTDGVIGQMPVA
jgi:hypothetical protein